MEIKSKILGVKMGDSNKTEGFSFLSYFYLHGEAEIINGYDLVEGNMETLIYALSDRIFPTKLILQDGKEYDGVVISYHKMGRMTGLICLCTDLEHIRHALFDYDENNEKNTVIKEGQKTWLYSKYPKIRDIVREYNLSR